jgi:hypothetical protein
MARRQALCDGDGDLGEPDPVRLPILQFVAIGVVGGEALRSQK